MENADLITSMRLRLSQNGLRSVKISIVGNCVTLTGCVRRYYAKQMAQESIRSLLTPSLSVNNLIEVKGYIGVREEKF